MSKTERSAIMLKYVEEHRKYETKTVDASSATCSMCGEPTYIIGAMYMYGICPECYDSLERTKNVER